jgi:hypothetical protein
VHKDAPCSDRKIALDGRRIPCEGPPRPHPFLCEPDIFLNYLSKSRGRAAPGADLSWTTGRVQPAQDPFTELRDALIVSNDDRGSSPDAAALALSGVAPRNPKESAILKTLAPGAYTVILKGATGGTGVGLFSFSYEIRKFVGRFGKTPYLHAVARDVFVYRQKHGERRGRYY